VGARLAHAHLLRLAPAASRATDTPRAQTTGMTANPLWGPDWAAVRRLWRLDPDIVHLNHGSFGAAPAMVRAEQDRWRAVAEANPTGFFWRMLPRELAKVRERVAGFVGADAADLALLPNASTAIGGVLASVELEAGDEVLITNHCYGGVRAAVEETCRRRRATPRTVVLSFDVLADVRAVVETIVAGITDRTRLAIVEHVTSPTGAVIDVAAVVHALRHRGVTVAIDGAHAPGSVAVDIGAIDADYYAANLHKWCCAPVGAGFVAVAARRRAGFRPAVVGSHWEDGFPAGVEWWGTADYSALLSAPAALALLEEIGVDRLRSHNHSLAALGQELVGAAVGTASPQYAYASMSLVPLPDGVASSEVTARSLRETVAADLGIEAMILAHDGRGYVRLSAHAYNCPNDYELLATGLPVLLTEATSPQQRRG
jgi:isopenicillin-N epimerase